jgi:hypothetical protein
VIAAAAASSPSPSPLSASQFLARYTQDVPPLPNIEELDLSALWGVARTQFEKLDLGVAWEVARTQFETFMREHDRYYGTLAEEVHRFSRFVATLDRVNRLNARTKSDVFGISFSADFFEDEERAIFSRGLLPMDGDMPGTLGVAARGEGPHGRRLKSLPDALDWRRTAVITPVKSQGGCGACWAFSAAQEVESMYILHLGEQSVQELFSVQQILSCAHRVEKRAQGCGKGHIAHGFLYLKNASTPGLAQAAFWPYLQSFTPPGCESQDCTAPCDRDLNEIVAYRHVIGPYATVTDAAFAIPYCRSGSTCEDQDLDGLAFALAEIGPLSVAVNSMSWDDYTGGVMTRKACGGIERRDMTHAAQLVGFNRTAPVPYWIVRNTWNTDWGQHGYIYLEMAQNTCGVANAPLYPVVTPGGHKEMPAAPQPKPWSADPAVESRQWQQRASDRFESLYRQAISGA